MSSQRPPAPSPGGNEPWTIRRVLQWTANHFAECGSETPRLDAEILLAHVRGCSRIELYTRYDEILSDEHRTGMRELVRRRANSEPVAYLVGKREFYSLDFTVTPDVLVPRSSTETLVLRLLDYLKHRPQAEVLELGTGSGCIPVSAAANAAEARFTAVDISPRALEVAAKNARMHGVADRIQFLQGDLFAPLDDGRKFHAVVSNPPYVRSGELPELHPDVRDHEPSLALDGGETGMDVARRIIELAPDRLHEGGLLALELSPGTIPPAAEQVAAMRCFGPLEILKDAQGLDRVLAAVRS